MSLGHLSLTPAGPARDKARDGNPYRQAQAGKLRAPSLKVQATDSATPAPKAQPASAATPATGMLQLACAISLAGGGALPKSLVLVESTSKSSSSVNSSVAPSPSSAPIRRGHPAIPPGPANDTRVAVEACTSTFLRAQHRPSTTAARLTLSCLANHWPECNAWPSANSASSKG